MDKLLYEQPDKYKCFLQDSEVHFELTIGGDTLSYTLSGHPYMPTFIAKCDDDIYSYSEECGLWFPKDADSDWSGFCDELADKLKKNYYAKHKAFDEKILAYKMNGRDEQLANIALLIIEAYNGSYKPHLFDEMAFHNSENYYDIKHTDEGYNLIFTKAAKGNPSYKRIVATNEYINNFVEHVFSELTGDTSVKWTMIANTPFAVNNALSKHYGMEVELSNVGYDHEFDMFGIPEPPIRPTIWAKRENDDTASKKMKDKGFTYFKGDLWKIEL